MSVLWRLLCFIPNGVLDAISTWQDRRWLEVRRARVISALMVKNSPLAKRSFIVGGVYHWKDAQSPDYEDTLFLDFVWPDVPLSIKVSSRCYAPYTKGVGTRRFWEEAVEQESRTVEICGRSGMPLLVIGPNDPVDEYTLVEVVSRLTERLE